MVDLNTKIVSKEQEQIDYSIPAPDGDYVVKVKSMDEWKSTTKNVKLKATGEMLQNCTIYNALVKLQVISGSQKGRLFFYNLSTHPNMPWMTSNFLYATHQNDLPLCDFQKKCVGEIVKVHVKTETRQYEDKDTGMVTSKLQNSVSSIKRLKDEELELYEDAMHQQEVTETEDSTNLYNI